MMISGTATIASLIFIVVLSGLATNKPSAPPIRISKASGMEGRVVVVALQLSASEGEERRAELTPI